MTARSAAAARYEAVRERIRAAAARAGRREDEITLIGVSKTVPPAEIQEVVDAGLTHLGENRIQEAEEKIPLVRPSLAGLTWHLVGHLQKNKAQKAVKLFSWIHSVDSASLISRLDRLAAEQGIRLGFFLEVNVGEEEGKHGVPPSGLGGLLEVAAGAENLHLAGLMAIPPIPSAGSGAEASRPHFRVLARLRDTWAARGYDLPALSMGMTGDFEVAIEEGATHVRVGRAIFGDRSEP